MISLDLKKCTECTLCEAVCPADAISHLEETPKPSCINCTQCAAVCPSGAIRVDGKLPPKISKQVVTHKQYEVLLSHARSCRNFQDKPVPRELIDELLDDMALVPSASNQRRVNVTIIDGEEKVAALNDYVSETLISILDKLNNSVVKLLLKIFAGKGLVRTIEAYGPYLKKRKEARPDFICFGAPMVILFHSRQVPYGHRDMDSHIWSANFYNLLCTRGLGACYIGFIQDFLNMKKKYRGRYGIPQKEKVDAALIVGYPKIKMQRQVSRRGVKARYI